MCFIVILTLNEKISIPNWATQVMIRRYFWGFSPKNTTKAGKRCLNFEFRYQRHFQQLPAYFLSNPSKNFSLNYAQRSMGLTKKGFFMVLTRVQHFPIIFFSCSNASLCLLILIVIKVQTVLTYIVDGMIVIH